MQIKKSSFVKQMYAAFISILVAVPLSANAQVVAEEDLLVVELTDGTVHTIQLSEKPEVSFDGKGLNVHSANDIFSRVYDNVRKFYYQPVNKPIVSGSSNNGVTKTFVVDVDFTEEKPTALQPDEIVGKVLSFRFVDGENVVIGGVDDGAAVSVFRANGMRVGATIERNADVANVSLSGLLPGIYIISVGNETFKVRVK